MIALKSALHVPSILHQTHFKFKVGYGGHDGRFLTHGDLWSNNVMFNQDDDCILGTIHFHDAKKLISYALLKQ